MVKSEKLPITNTFIYISRYYIFIYLINCLLLIFKFTLKQPTYLSIQKM